MNNIITQVFIKIANKMGLSLVKKKKYIDDYANIDDISITATLSNRLSTLTMLDSTISIEGNNKRALYVSEFMKNYQNTKLSVACEVALGTGDCLVKPNTDGKRIAIDIIENNEFIVNRSVGDFLQVVTIKCDEVTIKEKTYERFECHELFEYPSNYVQITQLVYCNGEAEPVSSVPQWATMQDIIIIPNVDRLLFGRYKCPTINRQDVNSINGVPITFGLNAVVEKSKEAYNRFNEEFEAKETMIFADKGLFTETDRNGVSKKVGLPNGKDRLIMNMRGNAVDSHLGITEYSPDIRSDSLQEGLETNLKMVELLTGLSNGVLTKPTSNYATATEMKANLQSTFAYITKLRKVIESGTNDLIYAINVICNANNITPLGDFTTKYEWSDSYVEQMSERFNQLVNAESVGAIDKAELRAWVMNEDYNTAKKKVEEIKSNMPSIINEVI